jgi:hypothetical protein
MPILNNSHFICEEGIGQGISKGLSYAKAPWFRELLGSYIPSPIFSLVLVGELLSHGSWRMILRSVLCVTIQH